MASIEVDEVAALVGESIEQPKQQRIVGRSVIAFCVIAGALGCAAIGRHHILNESHVQLGRLASKDLMMAATDIPDTAFPNAHMIASGYNIFYSDPMPKLDGSSDSGNLDPGLRKPVFKVAYSENRETSDRRHVRPDGYFATVDYGCSEVFSTKTVSDAYELSTETNMEASVTDTYGVDVSIPPPECKMGVSVGEFSAADPGLKVFVGVSGTLSAGAKQIKKDDLFNGHRIITTSARCAVYSAGLSYGSPPETHPAFQEVVDGAGGKSDWYAIFDEFGTHFLANVKMGARFGSQYIFANSHYDAFQSTVAKAGASVGPVISAGIKMGLETPDTPSLKVKWSPKLKLADVEQAVGQQVETLNQHASSQVYQGVGPPMPKGGISVWMDAVEKNPVPIRFSKMQICAHPGLVQEKRESCASAMKDYCKEHLAAKGADCEPGEQRECQLDSDCEVEHVCREFSCVKVPKCLVRMYDEAGYQGSSLDLDPVDSDAYPSGKPFKLKNSGWYDRISSVRLSEGCESIKLYDDDPGNFFEGYAQSPTYTSSQRGLPDDLNDDVWQILVKAKPIPGSAPFVVGAGKPPADLPEPTPIEFNPEKDHLFLEPGQPGQGLHPMDGDAYFSNIGKAMYGYNHYHGAPFSTKYAGVDPGFTTRGLWKVSYDQGATGKESLWHRLPMTPIARYFVVVASKSPHLAQAQADLKDPRGAAKRYFKKQVEALGKMKDEVSKWDYYTFSRWQSSWSSKLETYITPELAVHRKDDEYCSLVFQIRNLHSEVVELGSKIKPPPPSTDDFYGYWRRLAPSRRLYSVGEVYCEGGKAVTWTQEDADKAKAESDKAAAERAASYNDNYYGGYGWRRLNESRKLSYHKPPSAWYSTVVKPNFREFASLAHAKQALRSESKCLGQKQPKCPSGADYNLQVEGTTWDTSDDYGWEFSSVSSGDPWDATSKMLREEWPRFIVKVGPDDKVSSEGVYLINGQKQELGWKEGYDSVLPDDGTLSDMLKFVDAWVQDNPMDDKDMDDPQPIETAVPDGWEVIRSKDGAFCESDMKTFTMNDAHSYEKATSSSFGIPKTAAGFKGNAFSFGLSYEKKDFLSLKGSQSRKMTAATAECGSFHVKLTDLDNNPPETEPGLASLVGIAQSDEDYYLIFDQYGLHFPDEVVFGARYGTTQYITSSSFESYQRSEESLSLEFGVQAAIPTKVPGVKLKAKRDVKIGYDATEEQSESTEKYFNERRTFSVGKRIPAGGIEEWKKDMNGEPMPIKFSLIPICKHPVFKGDVDACQSAWDSYCEKHLVRMHPDLYCGESQEKECTWDLDCPEDYERCDAGMCYPKPSCVVTLYSNDNYAGEQKKLEPFFWAEHQPVHIVDLAGHQWKGKPKSISISGGCGKVIKMADNALDAEGNYVFTNWDSNDDKKKSGVRNANWLAVYPKENLVGETVQWV